MLRARHLLLLRVQSSAVFASVCLFWPPSRAAARCKCDAVAAAAGFFFFSFALVVCCLLRECSRLTLPGFHSAVNQSARSALLQPHTACFFSVVVVVVIGFSRAQSNLPSTTHTHARSFNPLPPSFAASQSPTSSSCPTCCKSSFLSGSILARQQAAAASFIDYEKDRQTERARAFASRYQVQCVLFSRRHRLSD